MSGLSLGFTLCQTTEPIDENLLLAEVFDRAIKKNKTKKIQLGEHNFEYALIHPKDGYGRNRISTSGKEYEYAGTIVTDVIKNHEKLTGIAANGCPLVFERALPRLDFADYVGLHEYVEGVYNIVSVGHDSRHGEACRIELEEIFKREEGFVKAYTQWHMDSAIAKLINSNTKRTYFRAIPSFIEFVQDNKSNALEVLKEYKKRLDSDEHLMVKDDESLYGQHLPRFNSIK